MRFRLPKLSLPNLNHPKKIGAANPSLILVMLSLLFFAAGCGGSQEKQGGEIQRYPFRGLVMAVERSRQRVTIAHEDIPHYMKAMTMSFVVKDTTLFRGIEVGDSVSGVLAVHQARGLD